ncbi:hypothetical protein ACFW9M_33010, partial [Streptomyces lydicus]|uniref:hypothetical protein n=1 Tax=Streptomyces lydicus TaxID=47763 RepID=UPI0036C58980
RCDSAFRLLRGSNLTRSVSVSGPLLERGWPFGFRFSAFPTLSDLVRAVAGSNLILIPAGGGLFAPFGVITTLAEFLVGT